MDSVARHVVKSLAASERKVHPWRHWLVDELVPDSMSRQLDSLPFELPSGIAHEGRREVNNTTRVFFDEQTCAEHPVATNLVAAFREPEVLTAFEQECDIELKDSLLRVEYAMDVGDFWLEPHVDITVKKLTLLFYLSVGEGSDGCGTSIFSTDPEHKVVEAAPFGLGKATLFIPGTDTWHGFHRRKINGVRKSLIINYVTNDWRARHELTSERPVK